MKDENKIPHIIEGLTNRFVLCSFEDLQEKQTRGDIKNSYLFLRNQNRILRNEITRFFLSAKMPTRFTPKELLIYYKFNKDFSSDINKMYDSETINSLEEMLKPYRIPKLKRTIYNIIEESPLKEIKNDFSNFISFVNFIYTFVNENVVNWYKNDNKSLKQLIFALSTIDISNKKQSGLPRTSSTTDDIIKKKAFFENFEEIEVTIASKPGNENWRQLQFPSSPELKRLDPCMVGVFSEDTSNNTIYDLDIISDPDDKYVCDFEYKNNLRFVLITNQTY